MDVRRKVSFQKGILQLVTLSLGKDVCGRSLCKIMLLEFEEVMLCVCILFPT